MLEMYEKKSVSQAFIYVFLRRITRKFLNMHSCEFLRKTSARFEECCMLSKSRFNVSKRSSV